MDVTATLVDMAVRHYLVIEEIPKEGWFAKPDWKLTKLKDADTGLLTYERLLLNGLFEDGDEVLLSDLKAQFVARLRKVQESLYADATNRKAGEFYTPEYLARLEACSPYRFSFLNRRREQFTRQSIRRLR